MSDLDRRDSGGARAPGVLPTAVVLAGLYVLEVFGLGTGFVSILASLAGITFLLPLALWAFFSGDRAMAASRFVRAGAFALLGAATVLTVTVHARTKKARAQRIIEACRAYKSQHGAFPDRLSDLVPEYLPAIPRVNSTLMAHRFEYWDESEKDKRPHHLLTYTTLPFGRAFYDLEEERWTFQSPR